MAEKEDDEMKVLTPRPGIRPLNCEFNVLSRPDGSVILSQGSTCVLAAMTGPVAVKFHHLKVKRAHVDCVYRPKSGLPTVHDRIREAIVRDACEACLLLEMHPRKKVAIQIQELDNRGGVVACGINAACLALLIGGLPMKFTIAAVHCIVDHDDSLVVDPEQLPKKARHKASLTFVFDSLERDLITVYTNGAFKMAQFQKAYVMCRKASRNIFGFYRNVIGTFHNDTNTYTAMDKLAKMTIIG